MICAPRTPHWNICTLSLSSPLSSCAPYPAFCHFSCQPAQLSSLKAIKWVFKQKTLACFRVPSKGTFLALETVQRLGSCLVGYLQTHSQLTNTEGWDIRMAAPVITTNSRHMVHRDKRREWQLIKIKAKISKLHYVIPELAVRVSVPGALMSVLFWRCSSQEVAHSNLSNERTFQARHCGLWLQPPAHAVLTTKKQAKLFTDSFLTSLAKMSPIPSSYCHHSWLSLYHSPSIFRSLFIFFSFLVFSLLKCGWSCCYDSETTCAPSMRRANRKCKRTNPTWATLRQLTHSKSHRSAAVLGMFSERQCLHSMW